MSEPKSRTTAKRDQGSDPARARAKHLPPRVPAGEEPLLVPARILNEVTYCERLAYLEWVQSEFAHNEFTLDGVHTHARANVEAGELRKPEEVNAGTGDEKPNVGSFALGVVVRAWHQRQDRSGRRAGWWRTGSGRIQAWRSSGGWPVPA